MASHLLGARPLSKLIVPAFKMISVKTFWKTREIYNFCMTFSWNAFLCLEGYFHKRRTLTPEIILSYSKHALDLFMFHNLVYCDTPRI